MIGFPCGNYVYMNIEGLTGIISLWEQHGYSKQYTIVHGNNAEYTCKL